MIIIEKNKEPIAPDIVFFGLILVNFGPLKILPKIKPPISEATHPNRIIKRIVFDIKILVNIKNKIQKLEI